MEPTKATSLEYGAVRPDCHLRELESRGYRNSELGLITPIASKPSPIWLLASV